MRKRNRRRGSHILRRLQRQRKRGLKRTCAGYPSQQRDLDRVDHYDWVEGMTLRWRSRLPTAPPFADTRLVYEIRYSLLDILVRRGDVYWMKGEVFFAQDKFGDALQVFQQFGRRFPKHWRIRSEHDQDWIERCRAKLR